MAIISYPQSGQPIDVSYISNIVAAVNQLSEEITPSSTKYVNVDTTTAGKQSVSVSETKIIAGYVEVVSNSTVTAGSEKEFSYTFPADFKYEPIAVATPIMIGASASDAGRNISIVLKSVSTSRVDGIIRFNANGTASVGVNLLIIGIPN
jgi:hypothetical protein